MLMALTINKVLEEFRSLEIIFGGINIFFATPSSVEIQIIFSFLLSRNIN